MFFECEELVLFKDSIWEARFFKWTKIRFSERFLIYLELLGKFIYNYFLKIIFCLVVLGLCFVIINNSFCKWVIITLFWILYILLKILFLLSKIDKNCFKVLAKESVLCYEFDKLQKGAWRVVKWSLAWKGFSEVFSATKEAVDVEMATTVKSTASGVRA